jgi:hypothetical protein
MSHNYITQAQNTVLVAVVIGSAVVPTMIAQAFFRPQIEIPPEFEEAAPEEVRIPQTAPQTSPGAGA